MVTSGVASFSTKRASRGQPRDGRGVAALGNQVAAGAAQRRERIVMDFASGDVGNFQVQELDQAAQDAALGLASQTEENEIVARENGVGDLRQYSFFVTVNPREERLSGFQLLQEIRAEFFLDGAARCSRRVFRKSCAIRRALQVSWSSGSPDSIAVPLYATRGIAAEFVEDAVR